MKRNAEILAVASLAALLATGVAFAAGTLNLPAEVRSSSVKLPRGVESQADFARHAGGTTEITVDPDNGHALAAENEENHGHEGRNERG